MIRHICVGTRTVLDERFYRSRSVNGARETARTSHTTNHLLVLLSSSHLRVPDAVLLRAAILEGNSKTYHRLTSLHGIASKWPQAQTLPGNRIAYLDETPIHFPACHSINVDEGGGYRSGRAPVGDPPTMPIATKPQGW
jgi:hypothetical protein